MGDRFRPGALVRLELGGPPMTVVEYGDYFAGHRCHGRWTDKNIESDGYFTDAELRADEDRG